MSQFSSVFRCEISVVNLWCAMNCFVTAKFKKTSTFFWSVCEIDHESHSWFPQEKYILPICLCLCLFVCWVYVISISCCLTSVVDLLSSLLTSFEQSPFLLFMQRFCQDFQSFSYFKLEKPKFFFF